MVKCEYCQEQFSEDELDVEGICNNCNEEYRCSSCSCMSDDLNDEQICEECVREAGIDFMEARHSC